VKDAEWAASIFGHRTPAVSNKPKRPVLRIGRRGDRVDNSSKYIEIHTHGFGYLELVLLSTWTTYSLDYLLLGLLGILNTWVFDYLEFGLLVVCITRCLDYLGFGLLLVFQQLRFDIYIYNILPTPN